MRRWLLHRPLCWAFGKVFGRHFWNGRGDTWCFTCGVTRYRRSRWRLGELMFRDTAGGLGK